MPQCYQYSTFVKSNGIAVLISKVGVSGVGEDFQTHNPRQTSPKQCKRDQTTLTRTRLLMIMRI